MLYLDMLQLQIKIINIREFLLFKVLMSQILMLKFSSFGPQRNLLSSTKLLLQMQSAKTIFLVSHSQHLNCRYVCRLPYKENPKRQGNSAHLAMRLFQSLEKQFETQPEFRENYIEFMDYKTSRHIKLCEHQNYTHNHTAFYPIMEL